MIQRKLLKKIYHSEIMRSLREGRGKGFESNPRVIQKKNELDEYDKMIGY